MKLAMPHIYIYVLVVVVLTFFQTSYAAPVDGRSVSVVEFGDGSGQVLGTFRQVGESQWVEQNRQGQTTFTFRETQRDDWSVYLHDDSRNASLQLDLHRKRVGYSDTNNPQMRDIYAIESSTAQPQVQQAQPQPQSQPTQNAAPQSGQVVKLRFQNVSPRDMDIYFNDENGETRYLATVQSGYQLTQPSPVGVRWHVAQDDQWKETYETTSESLQVIRFGN